MPCRDDWSSGPTVIVDPETKRRLDLTTRLLCSLNKELDRQLGVAANGIRSNVLGLTEWWKQHQEEDRRREARENEKKRKQREFDEQTYAALAKKLGKKGI